MTKVNISLQSRLIKTAMLSSMIAGIVALLFLVLISIYQSMSMQDEIMDEVADMLLSRDIKQNHGLQVDDLSEEFSINYQLTFDQKLLTQSKEFPSIKPSSILSYGDGQYAYAWHEQQLWRYYHVQDNERHMQVTLYQPLTERFDDFWGSISVYTAGLIILWLLQALLLNFSVRKQFSSIKRLSQHIAAKDSNDLSPIENIQPEFVELQPILQQLNLLFSRLQHALAAEQRFTADAAHELRSPLSAMQMRLQVLQRKHVGHLEQIQPDLVAIQQDLNRGVQVLENLLLLARLDPTDQQQLHKQQFDIQRLLHEVLASLEPFIVEKNIDVQLDFPIQGMKQEDEYWVWAQREFLYICIRNLIDNAIRYSDFSAKVTIRFQQTQQQSILLIEDNGQQLTNETLDRMGERFYRALGSKTQGSGLGLSICKKIIELHQGQLQFSRAPTGGLSVSISLVNKNIMN